MKVVDLSCDVAGRFAAKLFAMAGVEVVRPQQAEDRLTDYLDPHKRMGAWSPSLLENADLVFTSFDQGRWLGLAADLPPLPPACVQVTTSTFGTTGPYARLRGGPLAEWSAGGYFAITGDPDREPLIGPETLCGYVAGYTAAIGAEAALLGGKGRHVDISTMEAMLCVHQSTFARTAAGLGRRRTGRYTEVYPLVVRPCADGFVSLGVVTDAEFDRLAIAIGRPDLAVDARFNSPAARWAHCDELDAELALFLEQRTADEIVAILQDNAIAAAKVADCLDLLGSEQLAHRNYWHDTPGGRMPGNPVPAARRFAEPGPGAALARTDGLPLARLTVLDFTAFWAGPSATRCLADLGADVIKVEKPGSRIDLDDLVDDPAAMVQHLYHCKMNRNKRSLALDLTTKEGRDAAQDLARRADVLVENFRPGVASRLGLDPAILCAANPGLVYVSLSGFGSSGPWGAWRSYGPTIEAASSIEGRTGYAGGEPLRLGHTLPDGVGGLAGALAALRGLREREEQGRGGWFDLSQLEAYAAMSGEEVLAASRQGSALPRIGNRSRTEAIQGAFPCRGEEQWVAIRLADAEDMRVFGALAGLPDLEIADEDAVQEAIAGYTRTRDKHQVASTLQAAGLEAVAVMTPEDLLGDIHLTERGFFAETIVRGRPVLLPGTPLASDPVMAEPYGPAPFFGEHTDEIMAGL